MKHTFLFAALLLSTILNAAEFTAERTFAKEKGGTKQVNILPTWGVIAFGNKGKHVSRCDLQVGTNAGYFAWSKIKNAFSNPEQGVWQFNGDFPTTKTGGTVTITQLIELTPMGTFDISLKCEAKVPEDNKDTYLNFSAEDYAGKSIMINNKEYPVPDANKWGFVSMNNVENPTVVFYQWDPERKFQVTASGKVTVVCISSKNGEMISVKFWPGINHELKLNVKF